jgi:hypothetical protein
VSVVELFNREYEVNWKKRRRIKLTFWLNIKIHFNLNLFLLGLDVVDCRCFSSNINHRFSVPPTVHSPPRIIKQPIGDEMLFQVASQGDTEKPFTIECEAEGEPAPK